MKTETNSTEQNKLMYLSYTRKWEQGALIEHIVVPTADGQKLLAGKIVVDIDEGTGKRSYRAFDISGKEYPRNMSLYNLKKSLERVADDLEAAAIQHDSGQIVVRLPETQEQAPVASPYYKGQSSVKRVIKRDGRDKTHTRSR